MFSEFAKICFGSQNVIYVGDLIQGLLNRMYILLVFG